MHPEIENLINMALADGNVTEKERGIILRKAEALGLDKDEVEMILDGKIALNKKSNNPIIDIDSRKTTKHGEIKKCPACGSLITSFSTKCHDCGHEFSGIESSSAVQKFYEQLLDTERNIRNSASSEDKLGMLGMARLMSPAAKEAMIQKPILDAKSSIILTFPVPNSKEDIIEFLILAKSNISAIEIGWADKIAGSNSPKLNYRNAWLGKCEQVISKARFSMKDDKQTLEEINSLAKQLGIK